jgi:hypothetical protein
MFGRKRFPPFPLTRWPAFSARCRRPNRRDSPTLPAHRDAGGQRLDLRACALSHWSVASMMVPGSGAGALGAAASSHASAATKLRIPAARSVTEMPSGAASIRSVSRRRIRACSAGYSSSYAGSSAPRAPRSRPIMHGILGAVEIGSSTTPKIVRRLLEAQYLLRQPIQLTAAKELWKAFAGGWFLANH